MAIVPEIGSEDHPDDDCAPTDWDHFAAGEAERWRNANRILQAIERDDAVAFRHAARLVLEHEDGWSYAVDRIVEAKPKAGPAVRDEFLKLWLWRGSCLRRSAFGDAALVDAMRIIITDSYRGRGRRLYRGEGLDAYRRGAIGISWTPKCVLADYFASPWRVWRSSVVLEAFAPRRAILGTVPIWPEEYLVDPRLLQSVRIVQHISQERTEDD